MAYDYSIAGWSTHPHTGEFGARRVRSSTLVAFLGGATPAALRDLLAHGTRYSGHDFDTLSYAARMAVARDAAFWWTHGEPA